jgi:hypothetical protein
MAPIVAHHAGEESLTSMLALVGGGGLTLTLAIGRARLAAAKDRLVRIASRARGERRGSPKAARG